MKTLFLVRHAKSSWANTSLADRERPLNPRGKRDAPIMAERLRDTLAASRHITAPQLLLCSPAKRARRTARAFRKALHLSKSQQMLEERLYFQGTAEILRALAELDDGCNAVMVVGHNPDFTDLYNWLTGENIPNLPTCAVARLGFDVSRWHSIATATACSVDLDFPKKHRGC